MRSWRRRSSCRRATANSMLDGKPARLILIGDTSTPAGRSVESEALTVAIRLESAVRTAVIMERVAGEQNPFEYTFEQALRRWEEPPIRVSEITSSAIQVASSGNEALAHTSPGMMLQFAIAGLLTSASIIVSERKSRCIAAPADHCHTARAHPAGALPGDLLHGVSSSSPSCWYSVSSS